LNKNSILESSFITLKEKIDEEQKIKERKKRK